MEKAKILFLQLAFLVLLIGCSGNRYDVKIKAKGYKADIVRLDNILFEMSPLLLPQKLDSIKLRYPLFMKYFGYVINAGEQTDSLWNERVQAFATDKFNNEVYSESKAIFNDISVLKDGLTDAWNHYSHYFPGEKIPGMFTCVTGFNNSIIVADSVLGIGLDRYLGSGSKFYPKLGIYNYQAKKMVPERILTDCMYGWATADWDYSRAGYKTDNLLANIIHEGKLLYFTRCMLPRESDEIIFGFTGQQLQFCKNNEDQMWQYLIEHDLLFSTDRLTVRKFTGEAPFTSYFTEESPGRAAAWIGFRIVEAYMKNNPKVSLAGLMNESDPEAILEKARYKPR
jgi:hypothetical protein